MSSEFKKIISKIAKMPKINLSPDIARKLKGGEILKESKKPKDINDLISEVTEE